MLHKHILMGLLAIATIAVVSCSINQSNTTTLSTNNKHKTSPILLKNFTKHGVDVTFMLEEEPIGHYLLAATYSPVYESYHLYSKDLPPKGIDGIGRPTRLEIVSGPLEAVGELQENIPPLDHRFDGFDQPFPIYPDGPVTLSLPVNLTKPTSNEPAIVELSVTYTACSNKGVCLLPVFGEVISVTLPITLTNQH